MAHGNHDGNQDVAWASSPCSPGLLPNTLGGSFALPGGFFSDRPDRNRPFAVPRLPCSMGILPMHRDGTLDRGIKSTHSFMPNRQRSHSEGQILDERRLPCSMGILPMHRDGTLDRGIESTHSFMPNRQRSHSEGQILDERRLPGVHGQDAHATYPPLNPQGRGGSFSSIVARKACSRRSFPLHDLMRQLGITLCSFVFLGC